MIIYFFHRSLANVLTITHFLSFIIKKYGLSLIKSPKTIFITWKKIKQQSCSFLLDNIIRLLEFHIRLNGEHPEMMSYFWRGTSKMTPKNWTSFMDVPLDKYFDPILRWRIMSSKNENGLHGQRNFYDFKTKGVALLTNLKDKTGWMCNFGVRPPIAQFRNWSEKTALDLSQN